MTEPIRDPMLSIIVPCYNEVEVFPHLRRALESLLAFWASAGVDAMLLDEPLDRIAAGRVLPPAPPPRPAAAAPSTAKPGQPDKGGTGTMPNDAGTEQKVESGDRNTRPPAP